MSVITSEAEPSLGPRQLLVPALLALALIAFAIQLWRLQVAQASSIAGDGEKSSIRTIETLAPRGAILDRNGVTLAGLEPVWVVMLSPEAAEKHEDLVARLSGLLEVDAEVIEQKLLETQSLPEIPVAVHRGATVEQATVISEMSPQINGLFAEIQAVRRAPEHPSWGHLLGYVGRPDETIEDMYRKEGKNPPEYVGRDGLESSHDLALVGEAGKEKVSLNARMQPMRRLAGDQPVPGSRLFLSIDGDLQELAYDLLNATPSKRGAVAAIDPKTGEILVLADSPSFSLKLFDGGISSKDYQSLLDDPRNPLFKRAIAGNYSPGSTFKIFNSMAAAENGLLDVNRAVYCPGGKQLGNKFLRCENHGAGRSLTFHEALTKSCNTYFVDLGLKSGPDAMADLTGRVGFGSQAGIDLPGEAISDSMTAVLERKRDEGSWYEGSTANFAIGQGELSVTPLQMAAAMQLVANRGYAYRPHLVRAWQPYGQDDQRLVKEEMMATVDLPSEYWDDLYLALENVIRSGTARSAQIRNVTWGGKTGSTEFRGSDKTHAWFVGVAPLDEPEIVIAVLAEASGHGGAVAAPIAKQIVQAWLDRHSPAEPEEPDQPEDDDSTA